MTKNTTKTAAVAAGTMLFDDWFDAIEDAVRETVRGVIETIMEEELDATLSRPRYGRRRRPEASITPRPSSAPGTVIARAR